MQPNKHPRLAAFDSLENTIIDPQAARARLEKLGYTEDMWPAIVADTDRDMHEIKALIEVTRREGPTDLNDIYHDLYPNQKATHYAGDTLASTGSREAFTRFESPIPREITPGQLVIHAAPVIRQQHGS